MNSLSRDLTVLITLFCACVFLSTRSYWHYGWHGEALSFVGTYVVFLFALLLYGIRFYRVSLTLILLWFMVLSGFILPAEGRYIHLKHVRKQLVEWLKQEQVSKGRYPVDLVNYHGNKDGFHYYPEQNQKEFLLYFSTASKSVCHWYRTEYGEWKYCDD